MRTIHNQTLNERTLDGGYEVQLISAEHLAGMLQISERTLWRWLSARRVPAPLRVSGTVRWRLQEIKEWIEGGCQSPIPRDNPSRRKG